MEINKINCQIKSSENGSVMFQACYGDETLFETVIDSSKDNAYQTMVNSVNTNASLTGQAITNEILRKFNVMVGSK